MFTIDPQAHVIPHPKANTIVDQSEGKEAFFNASTLSDILYRHPGEWAVALWNQLPGVTPIHTKKFRNRSTAVERIWSKLCELYSDAVASEDMPKRKVKHDAVAKTAVHRKRAAKSPDNPKTRTRKAPQATAAKNGRKSAWAEELTEALRKRFKPGDSFELQDVYRLIPQFQRRHRENHHIAARLRTTLAQDLRGRGVVKTTGKGKYRLVA